MKFTYAHAQTAMKILSEPNVSPDVRTACRALLQYYERRGEVEAFPADYKVVIAKYAARNLSLRQDKYGK